MCSKVKSRFISAIGVVLASALLAAAPASAQTLTTGTLSGLVVDQQDKALPGVVVTATHEPTSTKYQTVTGVDGRYQIPNIRVGGPYTIVGTLSGFKDKQEKDVTVNLGEGQACRSQARPREFLGSRHGDRRSERLRPDARRHGRERRQRKRSNRCRRFSAASSTSPARRRTSSSSPDCRGRRRIHQRRRPQQPLQQHADRRRRQQRRVRSGGLGHARRPDGHAADQPRRRSRKSSSSSRRTTCGRAGSPAAASTPSPRAAPTPSAAPATTSAATRSWSAQIPGARDAANPTPADTKVGTFADKQGGVSLGGPIVQNKAFFFGNFDIGAQDDARRASRPTAPRASPGWHTRPTCSRSLDIAKNQYGYDAGRPRRVQQAQQQRQVSSSAPTSTCQPRNQLTVRINYVDGRRRDHVGRSPTNTHYALPERLLHFTDKSLSTGRPAEQLVRHGVQRVARRPTSASATCAATSRTLVVPVRPASTCQTAPTSGSGTEYSSQANKLNQDIVEVTDDLTSAGARTPSRSAPTTSSSSSRTCSSRTSTATMSSRASRTCRPDSRSPTRTTSRTSDNPTWRPASSPCGSSASTAATSGARSNFTVTYGLRVDMPALPRHAAGQPHHGDGLRLHTDVVPSPHMWSPRAGFNWDLSNGGKRSQVRGGIGFFTGSTPLRLAVEPTTRTPASTRRACRLQSSTANQRSPSRPIPTTSRRP